MRLCAYCPQGRPWLAGPSTSQEPPFLPELLSGDAPEELAVQHSHTGREDRAPLQVCLVVLVVLLAVRTTHQLPECCFTCPFPKQLGSSQAHNSFSSDSLNSNLSPSLFESLWKVGTVTPGVFFEGAHHSVSLGQSEREEVLRRES